MMYINYNNELNNILVKRITEDKYSTAWPLDPLRWNQYTSSGELEFPSNGRLSFYIHIPFCKHLCKFCEYTRCITPDKQKQRNYLRIVHRDIQEFLHTHPDIILQGLDIGGGTPTALSKSNFAYLIDIYSEIVEYTKLSEDFEPSIEGSFSTISDFQILNINNCGIKRISLGVQSISHSFLYEYGREGITIDTMYDWIQKIRNTGNFKINLDFMYGFDRDESNDNIRYVIEKLQPDQVTLYELRINQLHTDIKLRNIFERYKQYCVWYNILNELGYFGNFGQNTFSKSNHDYGTSSYIRHRMLDGSDYKGFGISAQSMVEGNVEYNIGKNYHSISSLIPSTNIFPLVSYNSQTHYKLPYTEKLAKFICISSYSGGFNMNIAKRYYNNFDVNFYPLISFLIKHGLIEVLGDRVVCTREGFQYYGAIFSLFYDKL